MDTCCGSFGGSARLGAARHGNAQTLDQSDALVVCAEFHRAALLRRPSTLESVSCFLSSLFFHNNAEEPRARRLRRTLTRAVPPRPHHPCRAPLLACGGRCAARRCASSRDWPWSCGFSRAPPRLRVVSDERKMLLCLRETESVRERSAGATCARALDAD